MKNRSNHLKALNNNNISNNKWLQNNNFIKYSEQCEYTKLWQNPRSPYRLFNGLTVCRRSLMLNATKVIFKYIYIGF